MDQDFGYVKVRMGPLFPSKENVSLYNHYQAESERRMPQYHSSRHLETNYARHATPNYEKYHEQSHPGGSRKMQHPDMAYHKRMSNHLSPNDYYYPEVQVNDARRRQSAEVAFRRRENQLTKQNQVQRSTTFYSASHQGPLNYRGDRKPAIPQPDYGSRSRSVNPEHRTGQKCKRSNSMDPQHRTSHESRRTSQGLYYGHGHRKEVSCSSRSATDNPKKPFIPKPDYTWHRKKKPVYD